MNRPIEPEFWRGHNAQEACLARAAERLADVVRIGIGFSATEEIAAPIADAYGALCRTADIGRVLYDPWSLSGLAAIETALVRGDSEAESSPAAIRFLVERLALSASILERRPFSCVIDSSVGAAFGLPGRLGRVRLPVPTRAPGVCATVDATGTLRLDERVAVLEPPFLSSQFELLTSDMGLPIPPLPGQVPVSGSDVPEDRFSTQIASALDLINLDANSLELVQTLVLALLPLHRSKNSEHLSSSIRAVPGVIAMDLYAHPVDIAEALVHEADHQRYYVLTEQLPVWLPDNDPSAAYRSPWRPDPRPLDGLLGGASAFSAIGVFFARVLAAGHPDEIDRRSLGQRGVHGSRQALQAISVLREFASPTEFGQRLIDVIAARAAEALSVLASQPHFRRWDTAAVRCMEEHDAGWSHEPVTASNETTRPRPAER